MFGRAESRVRAQGSRRPVRRDKVRIRFHPYQNSEIAVQNSVERRAKLRKGVQ